LNHLTPDRPQSGLLIAFKELQPAAVGDAAPQLDLQLFVTELTTPSVWLRSRWTLLLEAIAANAVDAAALKSALEKACERHPDDLSTRILATQLALLTKDEPAAKSLVSQLVRHVEEHPLDAALEIDDHSHDATPCVSAASRAVVDRPRRVGGSRVESGCGEAGHRCPRRRDPTVGREICRSDHDGTGGTHEGQGVTNSP
jgi:hypothetical protein